MTRGRFKLSSLRNSHLYCQTVLSHWHHCINSMRRLIVLPYVPTLSREKDPFEQCSLTGVTRSHAALSATPLHQNRGDAKEMIPR
jgi:hypothetical protein